MTATKMMLLWLAYVISISISVKASPTAQGTNVKLQFYKSRSRDSVKSDINQSAFTENAYANVAYQELDQDDDTKSAAEQRRNYTAVLTRFDENGITSNKSCTVEFKPDKLSIGYDFLVYSLYDDKIVLAYVTGTYDGKQKRLLDSYQNYRIIHMDTCKFYDAKIEVNPSPDTVVRAVKDTIFYHQKDDTFNVFVTNDACDGGRCNYTFSDKAEQIGEPVSFLPSNYKSNIVKIVPSTKSSSHFVFVSDWKVEVGQPISRTATHAEFTGSQKLLYSKRGIITELTQFDYEFREDNLFVKNTNGFLSLCRKFRADIKNEMNCMQFSDDVMTFNRTTVLSDSEGVLGIYNLPTGGIILVKGNCEDWSCSGMSFEKWSHDVQAQKLYSVEDFKYQLSKSEHVIVNTEKDNELCVTIYESKREKYDFSKKCFPIDLFSLSL